MKTVEVGAQYHCPWSAQVPGGDILGEIDYLLATRFGVQMVVLRAATPPSG